jgi:hypothetical protein
MDLRFQCITSYGFHTRFFSSLKPCTGPPILMGDDTPVKVCGQGRVDLDNGSFENVLHVPKLSINISRSIRSLTLAQESG